MADPADVPARRAIDEERDPPTPAQSRDLLRELVARLLDDSTEARRRQDALAADVRLLVELERRRDARADHEATAEIDRRRLELDARRVWWTGLWTAATSPQGAAVLAALGTTLLGLLARAAGLELP